MVRGSRPKSRARVTNAPAHDNIVDNSIIFKYTSKRDGRNPKSVIKKHKNVSNKKISVFAHQKRLRRVSFHDHLTLLLVKRIPKTCKTDLWYTANELNSFRTNVMNSKELSLKVKLKSARSRNHVRKVLLQYRTDRANEKIATSRSTAMRSLINLRKVSMKSSAKTREVAIRNANKLEREIFTDQSCMNPTITGACLGPVHRWAFDYYLGSMIDTLCTVSME